MTAFGSQDQSIGQLEMVLQATRVGLWDWNVQTGEVDFSARWAEIIGYAPGELNGTIETWLHLAHPDDLKRSEDLLKRHFSGELPYYEYECRMRHKDGRWVWVLDRGMVVSRTESGGPLQMTGTHADITLRKTAEENERQARENFETLFNTVEDFLFVLDQQGLILYANKAVIRRLGYTQVELSGMPVIKLHPEARRAEATEVLGSMLAGKVDFCPVPLISRSGEQIPVETRVTLGHWDGKQVLFGVSKDATDISGREQAEYSLFRQTTLLSSLLDSIPDIVFFKDQQGVYLGCNPPFAEVVGRSRNEIVGKTDYDLFGKEVADSFRSYDRRVMQETRAQHNEEEVVCPDGRRMMIDTFKAPLITQDGQAIGVLGISRDITDRKRAEEELNHRESYLSAIIENLPGLVWLKDKESRFLAVNEAFAKSCGVSTVREINGKTDRDIWPHDLAEKYRMDDRAVMRQTGSIVIEEPIADREGTHWVETYKTSVVDISGSVIGTVGYAQDITPRKESEERIRRLSEIQNELMRLAIGFVNIPVLRQDEAVNEALKTIGTLIGADRSYLFHYDFNADSMSNTHEWHAEEITPEIDNLQNIPFELVPDWVSAHRQGGAFHVASVQELPCDSALREILEPQGVRSLITLPLMDGTDCFGFVGFDAVKDLRIWRDEEIRLLKVLAEMLANLEIKREATRALKQVNKELVHAKNDADAGARAKSMFLANMSHEIRTPLNAVLGHAQIMDRECRGCPSKRRSLPAIITSGEHLLELINNLLELVQSDIKEVPVSFSDFDFYSLLDSIRMMSNLKAGGAVSLDTVQSPGLPQFLHSDPGKIRQVLINLVGNAAKFTEKGNIRITAGMSPCCEDGNFLLTVDVEDSGCGIEPDSSHRIFDPFEQGLNDCQLGKGTGLGLPLSRRHAQALGGNVELLRSEENKGSVFRFTFKAAPAQPATAEPEEARVVCCITPGQRVPQILVVDDDAGNLQMLCYMLEEAGFKAEAATSGQEALETCRAGREYDLILMDKRMPGLDGIETLQRLHEIPAGRDLPVVIITASGLANEEALFLAAGATGYISKPVSREKLLAEIGRITGVHYEYDRTNQATSAQRSEVVPDDLLAVSSDLLLPLRDAVRLGNVSRMRQIAAEIESAHPQISGGLTALINRYDYAALLRILTTETKETS